LNGEESGSAVPAWSEPKKGTEGQRQQVRNSSQTPLEIIRLGGLEAAKNYPGDGQVG
jgi:hypothetical protein